MATSQDTTFVSQTTAITAPWAQSLNDSLWKARNPLFTTSTGSGSSYVIKLPTGSLYSSIVAGDSFSWKAHTANTGVTTLTIVGSGSLGPKPLTKNGSTALSINDIAAGAIVECVYDGSGFQVTSITATSGGGGGDMPLFTQVGTGAVPRTFQTKGEDVISVKDFGAVGDGTTDDTAAFLTAETNGFATTMPEGTYKLTSAVDLLTPFIAYNGTFDYSGHTSYIRNYTDLGRKTLYRQIYRAASEYVATPTTYTNLFNFAGFHLNHFSTLGYQQFYTSDSGGRTMQPGYSVDGAHSGYGDVCAFYGNYGVGKHPSAASISGAWTGANSGTVSGGQISATSDRTNLYGCEYHLDDHDNGTVAAIGAVYDFRRGSNAQAYKTLWAGVRAQTSGTYPMDVAFQAIGKAQVGLDFSGVDFVLLNGSPSLCAIALKANDRINFNVAKKTAPTAWHAMQDVLPPETYMTFLSSTPSFCFVHDGTIGLQTSKTLTTVRGAFEVYKSGTLLFDIGNAVANKIFLGNTGYTVSINQRIQLTNQVTASSANAGSATALPAQPFTYLSIDIDGTVYKIPVYNN